MSDTLVTSLCPTMHSTQGGRVTHAIGKPGENNRTCSVQHLPFTMWNRNSLLLLPSVVPDCPTNQGTYSRPALPVTGWVQLGLAWILPTPIIFFFNKFIFGCIGS